MSILNFFTPFSGTVSKRGLEFFQYRLFVVVSVDLELLTPGQCRHSI